MIVDGCVAYHVGQWVGRFMLGPMDRLCVAHRRMEGCVHGWVDGWMEWNWRRVVCG